MIDERSYSEAVADELSLAQTAHAEDVTGEVSLTSSAYGEDVAAAINNRPVGDVTLRVLQYNIGHFNMGYNAAPTAGSIPTTSNVLINSNKADGYPNTVDRNYAIQLQRWKNRISGINADIIGAPEWNNYFGWLDGVVKTTAEVGIFDGYNISAGKITASGWWQNTLVSKYAISNAQDIDLGSLSGTSPAYVRVATVTIAGKQVKIAVTHLNWNQSQTFYNSRVNVEIPALVNLLKDEPYVILCGDFNTQGVMNGASSPDNKTGLDEFQPFADAGFTLANSTNRPLLTSIATNSRPDLSIPNPDKYPNYPYAYLDNIIVKGFTMSNVTVVDDGMLTDHCGLYCDLTIID